MEITKCDLCGTEDSRLLFERADRFSGEVFRYVSCLRCGLIYLNPRPTEDELGKYYPDNYEAFRVPGEAASLVERWDIRRALKIQLDFVEKYAPGRGSLLDIGCATGVFMNAAHERGWKVTGVELIEQAARVARERYGLDVKVGSLESTELPEESSQVITLWDVLEHLPSPVTSLKRCRRLLKKDGLLIFSIPNLASFDRYLFGKRWIGWDAPRHFHLFTRETLERLLPITGFELIGQRCILGGKGAFLLNLDTIWKGSKIRPVVRKFYPLIGLLLWPYRQVAYLTDRGPIITYVARKSG